jgi:FKBP-type peptidyl-prolyl cis-trans isomerase (trigger factor)
VLIDEQVEQTLRELKQDLVYRGQTYQEFLDQSGITDEENRKQLIPGATERVKAGLVLSEIADKEKITVSQEELDGRLNELKQQYKDEQMQAELSKPEARRDIANRILTQKTVDLLVKLNS